MGAETRNRFIQILHKGENISKLNSKKKKRIIDRILADVATTGIFDEDVIHDDVDVQEQKSLLEVNSEIFPKKSEKTNLDQSSKKISIPKKECVSKYVIRYGRSPLHEAVAMRDLGSITLYINKGQYLSCIDNNGDTPYEMAYHENYQEALELFDC